MTANKPMTGEQLDELLTVAVNMQRDAETDCNRPSAMFAYAVQVAVLELRKVRNDASALAAENAGLKVANAEGCKWDGEQWVGISIQTPATEAFLAEVRAQGVEEFLRGSQLPYQIATVLADYDNVDDATLQTVIWSGQPPEPDGDVWHLEYVSRGNAIVRAVLKELRKGVQS
ncbi:hypothetical protein V6269_05290 [Enterobacter roggenkampii]|uniref:hypothetical protein n=1 Tax=Enterobacter roggenkampii TaxID=1812935 RepID=UPI003B83ACAD